MHVAQVWIPVCLATISRSFPWVGLAPLPSINVLVSAGKGVTKPRLRAEGSEQTPEGLQAQFGSQRMPCTKRSGHLAPVTNEFLALIVIGIQCGEQISSRGSTLREG